MSPSMNIVPLVGLLPILFSSFGSSHPAVTVTMCSYGACEVQLRYAVLGDSWASGVAYDAGTEYDHNKDRCLRSLESAGVQLKNNANWADAPVYFDFPACSGAHIGDMAAQLHTLTDPDVLILTIGGNDIGFFDVVDSCVYRSNKDLNYEPGYENDPGRIGRCAKAVDKASDYIKDPQGFAKALSDMYDALLQSDQYKNNPDLRIYQTGYSHFFSVAPGSDWCEGTGFPSAGDEKAVLNRPIREDMNELVERANQVVKQVTSSFKGKHIGYVSITEKFDGHRFCEAHSNYLEQFGLFGRVWYYNIWPVFTATGEAVNVNADNVPKLTQPLFKFNVNPLSNPGDSGQGSWLRPFHPTKSGFGAIQDAIIEQLKKDKVPGVST